MWSSARSARDAASAGEAHRAGGLVPGGQNDRRRRPVRPPPAHHPLIGGGREEAGVEGMGTGHCAFRVGARASGPPLRVRRHSREYGPLPCGREGQGRAEHLRLSAVSLGQEPASLSEDLAHERSFLSVARLATPRTTSHHVSITSLCVPAGASHPRQRQGEPLWAERWAASASILRLAKARAWRGVAAPGVCRRAYFSPPPPREDGARSSVVKTPGSVARFRDDPNHPWPSPSTYPSRPL